MGGNTGGWIWATYHLSGSKAICTVELAVDDGWTRQEIIERLAKRHRVPVASVDLRVAA